MRIRKLVVCLVLVCALLPSAAGAGEPDPLAFLEPFIGAWRPPPDDPMRKEHPEMGDFVAFLFEWAGAPKKILRFYEGLPDGDRERRIVETLVTANPRTGEVLMLGFQTRSGSLYQGSFKPIDDGFVRLYTVTYPRDQELADPADAARGAIDYRDVCRLIEPDTLECTTEQKRDGEWRPWGKGEPYRLMRATK